MQKVEYERRVLAYLIDVGTIFIITSLIMAFIKAFDILQLPFFKFIPAFVLFTLLLLNLVVYFTITYFVFNGVTFGGLISNVRIVKKDSARLSFNLCFVRALLLSLVVLAIYNAVYMLLKRTQVSFYDECTNTIAVKRKNAEIQ